MAAENDIRMRLELRIPRELYEYLQEQSSLKRLSFEGLVLACLRQQMEEARGR